MSRSAAIASAGVVAAAVLGAMALHVGDTGRDDRARPATATLARPGASAETAPRLPVRVAAAEWTPPTPSAGGAPTGAAALVLRLDERSPCGPGLACAQGGSVRTGGVPLPPRRGALPRADGAERLGAVGAGH